MGEIEEKKHWPFVKSGQSEKKEITPTKNKLKEEIVKRKEEINSSGLKRNEILSKENLENGGVPPLWILDTISATDDTIRGIISFC